MSSGDISSHDQLPETVRKTVPENAPNEMQGTETILEKALLIPESHLGQLQVNVFSLTHSKQLLSPCKL